MKNLIYLFAFIFSSSNNFFAQTIKLGEPLDKPFVLSSNFGELRPNHFHSGLDFKTQGVINKNLYSVYDGHVSRISVSPGGYGLALYIDHPNGLTSVYGHIEKFNNKIEQYVREQQNNMESYSVDLQNIPENILPVKKGDFIAFSGNTGGSGGPHLHFELRKTDSNEAIDPMIYYSNDIMDTTPPNIRGICMFNFSNPNEKYHKSRYIEGQTLLKNNPTFKTWGKVYFGVFAYDKMDGTGNIYGVKKIELFCDDKKISSIDITNIDFSKTRMINSLVEYNKWMTDNKLYVKSIKELGNKLDIYDDSLMGYIDINEDRVYKLKYVLTDFKGNNSQIDFEVIGSNDFNTIVENKDNKFKLLHNKNNRYITDSSVLMIPKNNLYRDVDFEIFVDSVSSNFSPIYYLNNEYEPLNKKSSFTIYIENDTLKNKKNYGVVDIRRNGRKKWLGGDYVNGKIKSNILELGGRLTVMADTIAPKIQPYDQNSWKSKKLIRFIITDDFSGIKKVNATIDGDFMLLSNDIKSSIYSHAIDEMKTKINKNHNIKIIVEDNAGNSSVYESTFFY